MRTGFRGYVQFFFFYSGHIAVIELVNITQSPKIVADVHAVEESNAPEGKQFAVVLK